MTDVDKLVRATLNDPRRALAAEPSLLEGYRDRARRIRRGRRVLAVVSAAATVAAVTGGVIVLRPDPRGSDDAVAVGTPTATATGLSAVAGVTVDAVPSAVDVVASGNGRGCSGCGPALYVLGADGRVFVTDPAQGTLLRSSPERAMPVTATMRPAGITVVDGGPAPTEIWTWSVDRSTSVLRKIAFDTLLVSRTITLSDYVHQAVIVNGALWIAGDKGVSRLDAGADKPTAISAQPASSIAVDRRNNQLVVGQDPDVVTYDMATGREKMRAHVKLGKISVSVAGSGDVWAAGYDTAGPVDKKVVHLDSLSLEVIGTTPMNDLIGPGAVVWPGAAVVWVENNGGSATCVDASTGAVLSRPLAGNAKVGSAAVGVGWSVEGGFLTKLSLPASCPG
jgi:hypothetical protein